LRITGGAPPPEYIAQKRPKTEHPTRLHGRPRPEERKSHQERATSLLHSLRKQSDHKSKFEIMSWREREREREECTSIFLKALSFLASQIRRIAIVEIYCPPPSISSDIWMSWLEYEFNMVSEPRGLVFKTLPAQF
jgi:hypothetical protein